MLRVIKLPPEQMSATRKKNPSDSHRVKLTRPKEGPSVSTKEFLALKKPKGDLILEIEGERIPVTSLDRIYWPDEKLTKFDLLCYYLRVADLIMPFLQDRPAILQRYPRGIKAPMFFQQDLDSAPEFIKTARLPTDLDPKSAPWENVLQVALVVKEVADEIGLQAFPKTSGSSGIHIYVPLKPANEYEKVAEFARLFASEVAQRAPKIATVERSIAKRKSTQVYVDWMQNARGKSLAAVFTARAKPKAPVSMPLTWKQIEKGVKIQDFTIVNVPDLLQKKGDAWAEFFNNRQALKF